MEEIINDNPIINSDDADYESVKNFAMGKFICLEGNIGAYKTTTAISLVKFLREKLKIETKYVSEPFNKEMLTQFISDPKKYGYKFQIFMMEQRVKITIGAKEYLEKNPQACVIGDRVSHLGDMIFAQLCHNHGNMNDGQFSQYKEKSIVGFTHLQQMIDTKQALILYLKRNVEECYQGMIERNRCNEKDYSREYFQELHECHEKVFNQLLKNQYYIISTNQNDLDKEIMFRLKFNQNTSMEEWDGPESMSIGGSRHLLDDKQCSGLLHVITK